MFQNKHKLLWYAKRAGVAALVLVLGALIFSAFAGPSASGSPGNDKELTRVYQHTYDEVFQASQEAIERMGLYVTAKDKDKGTISGNGNYQPPGAGRFEWTFDIHIETLSTKPETRVTINANAGSGCGAGCRNAFKQDMAGNLQKVLSTYH